MARTISEVVKDAEAALTNVQTCKKKLTECEEATSKAAIAHREAQDKASALRTEVEEIFNAFVPAESQGRVR